MDGNTATLDAIYERRPPFNPTEVVSEVANFFRAYGVSSCTGDRWAQGFVMDAFAKEGISYQNSERDRSTIYIETIPLFTSGRVALLDNARLVGQLAGLERRTGSGREKVDHGPNINSHDDLANVCCGALTIASGGAGFSGWVSYWRGQAAEIVQRLGLRHRQDADEPQRSEPASTKTEVEAQPTQQPAPPPPPPPPAPPPPAPPPTTQQPAAPLAFGDTSWRRLIPDVVPVGGMVRLIAAAPWARFFVGAPGGLGQTFTAGASGEIEADVMFLGALLQAGCKPVQGAHHSPTTQG